MVISITRVFKITWPWGNYEMETKKLTFENGTHRDIDSLTLSIDVFDAINSRNSKFTITRFTWGHSLQYQHINYILSCKLEHGKSIQTICGLKFPTKYCTGIIKTRGMFYPIQTELSTSTITTSQGKQIWIPNRVFEDTRTLNIIMAKILEIETGRITDTPRSTWTFRN